MSMPAAAATSAPATRRARQRQATVAEIKALARRQLAEHGTGAVNLRAIAREMGTAPSALYRYFASHDELISALCADAYDSVADAVAAARDAVPGGEHARRWRAVCDAYRRWSLDHPADFALIFGTPVPGYRAPGLPTGPAASRFLAVPLDVFAAAVAVGAADPARTQIPPDLPAGVLLQDLLGRGRLSGASHLAAIAITAWASVLGFLTAEIFGSLHQLVTDPVRLWDAHLRTVMLGMGFVPALISGQPDQPPAPGQRPQDRVDERIRGSAASPAATGPRPGID
ncbi:MAG TPA: TetR/AcrR family transcriptional regulator [Streptosporangiaceae bacterium]